MNDETMAALERAAAHNEDLARTVGNQRCAKDAALIRAHIETLRAGGERAQIVAWLRCEQGKGSEAGCDYAEAFADQIEAGAHIPATGEREGE